MVNCNGAMPMPPFGMHSTCGDKKTMKYIGKRTKAWIDNKVDAKYGETYLCTDEKLYYMSIDANEWVTWPADREGPVPPTPVSNMKIYKGIFNSIPETIDSLSEVEVEKNKILSDGYTNRVTTSNQYAVLAVNSDDNIFVDEIKVAGFSMGYNEKVIGNYILYYFDNPTTETNTKYVYIFEEG